MTGQDHRARRRGKLLGANGGRTRAYLEYACDKQGFPGLDLTHLGWRVDAACEAIGNGVPRVMGEAIAQAIGAWWDEQGRPA